MRDPWYSDSRESVWTDRVINFVAAQIWTFASMAMAYGGYLLTDNNEVVFVGILSGLLARETYDHMAARDKLRKAGIKP